MAHPNSVNPMGRMVLLLLLIVLLFGLLPAWPYSAGWGYYPAGGVGLILLIVILLLVVKKI